MSVTSVQADIKHGGDDRGWKFKTQKMNNVKIEPIPQTGGGNTGLVKGADLFDIPYCNINIFGKKHSGKTWVLFNIIKNCVTPGTAVYIFAATAYNDQSWIDIRAWLEKHDIPTVVFTDLGPKGCNLNDIITDLEAEGKQKEEEKKKKGAGKKIVTMTVHDNTEMDRTITYEVTAPKEKAVKKPKYMPLDNLFIFDDMGKSLRSPAIGTLLKLNRHFLSKTIISAHDFADMDKDARAQGQYWLLFPRISEDRQKMVYDSIGIHHSFEVFQELYKQATAEEHQFLYIDVSKDTFRKNFDEALVVPEKGASTATAAAPAAKK